MHGVIGGTVRRNRIRRMWLSGGRAALGKTIVIVVGAIAGLALAGCSSSHAGQAGVAASSVSSSAPACTAADLRISNGPAGGAATEIVKLIDIVNVSSKACLMRATPALWIKVAGKSELLRYSQAASSAAKVRFGPDSSAILSIVISDYCTYSMSARKSITAASVNISGRTIAVAGWMETPLPPCGTPTALPITSSVATSSALPDVDAKLAIPTGATVRPGSVLALGITLKNTLQTTFGTRTCPEYTITLFGPMQPGATKTTERGALPCGAARDVQLESHGSVSYPLSYKIPATAAPGVYKLYWLSASFPGAMGGALLQIG